MDIYATIVAAGVPVNGLTDDPEIRIRDGSNSVVQAFTAMTDFGADGKYFFDFTIPDLQESYSYIIDADPLVSGQVPASDRYYVGSFSGEDDLSMTALFYADGVWFDSVGGGAAGQVLGVNGTQTNPVDNVTDLLAIANALNIRSFKLRGSLTLNAAFPRGVWVAVAGGGTLDPAGFDVGGGVFDTVGLTGNINTASGAVFGFQTSLIGPTTGFVGVLVRPGLNGTITLGAGTTTIAQGSSLVPGLSTPVIDLNGVASLSLRAYSGGLDLRGSSAGGQNSSIEIVAGQVILDASNTAGTIAVRGWPNVIDNSAGATIDFAGLGSIIVDDELTAQHGAGSWAGIAATLQQIRDAMKLAPTAGVPAAGSVDELLIDILADTAVMEPIVSTNLDVLVSSRNSVVPLDAATDAAAHLATQNLIGLLNNISITDVQTALTAQGYTAGRALLLDNLDAAITSRAAPGDAMGLTAGTLIAIQSLILSDATPFQGGDIALILTATVNLASFIEGGREIDFVGSDTNGWQRIERNIGGTLIRRYNLFDENDARIDESVASFIGRQGMISRETIV